MKPLLYAVVGAELVVSAFWTVAMARETGSSGIAVLGWVQIVVVIYGVGLMTGVLAFRRRSDLRRAARLAMALPFIGGVAPFILRGFTGGSVGTAFFPRLLAPGVGLTVLFGLAFPRRLAGWLPAGLFRSRGLNVLLLGLLAVGWITILAGGLSAFSAPGRDALREATRGGSGVASAYMIIFASVYLLVLGAVSAATGLWGWLGLRGGTDGAQRGIHLAQLLGSLPGILFAAAVWGWLAGQR